MFRKRVADSPSFRTPGHPITTAIFTLTCWIVVIGTFVRFPVNSAIGLAILLAGLPAYAFWRRVERRRLAG